MTLLVGTRYALWAELVGARGSTFDRPEPDYPRADLASFYRSVPSKQDARSLFYLRDALQSLRSCLDRCLEEPQAPELLADVLRLSYEIFWIAQSNPWRSETLPQRDEEYRHHEVFLQPGAETPGRVSKVRRLFLLSALHARASLIQEDDAPRKEFGEIVIQLVEDGFFPRTMRELSLGDFRQY